MMVSIIGAGPAGAYCSKILSDKGFDVKLFEEHKEIGMPVQCTGIITKEIKKFFKRSELDSFVINKIKKIRIFSPDGNYVVFPAEEYVVDRTRFDNFLSDSAEASGTRIYLSHKYVGHKHDNIFFSGGNKLKYDKLIGADGPNSSVAKDFRMYGNRKFILGMQARIKYDSNPEEFCVFFDNKKFPGFFGWQVPESDKVSRVGMAGSFGVKNNFDAFLKRFDKAKVIEYQAGLIPIYNPHMRTQKDNSYLLGDAACQVKATTGGGILQGLTAARCLSKAISKEKDYQTLWKKDLGFELGLHLKIRKMLNSFYNKDYDRLIRLMSQKRIRKILSETSRDNVFALSSRLLLNEPRFAYFIKNFIKSF